MDAGIDLCICKEAHEKPRGPIVGKQALIYDQRTLNFLNTQKHVKILAFNFKSIATVSNWGGDYLRRNVD